MLQSSLVKRGTWDTVQTLFAHTWRGLWPYHTDTVVRVFPLWLLSGQEIIFAWCGPLEDVACDQSGLLCVCVSDSNGSQPLRSIHKLLHWMPSVVLIQNMFAKHSPVSCARKSHKLPIPAFDVILFSVQYVSEQISVIVMHSVSQMFIHFPSFSYEIKTFNSRQKPFVLLFHLWRICCCQ